MQLVKATLVAAVAVAILSHPGVVTAEVPPHCTDWAAIAARLGNLSAVPAPGPFRATPKPEVDALVDLYHSTNGPKWTKSTNWLKGDPCGSPGWYGIRCSGGHVQQLLLQQNQLTGSLPASLGNLTEVTVASLDCFNSIGGTLPASIGSMTKCFCFTMASDKLSGTIPSSICDMSALSILHLGGESLTTPLPSCMGSLVNQMSSCGLETEAFKCPLPSWATSKCDATCT